MGEELDAHQEAALGGIVTQPAETLGSLPEVVGARTDGLKVPNLQGFAELEGEGPVAQRSFAVVPDSDGLGSGQHHTVLPQQRPQVRDGPTLGEPTFDHPDVPADPCEAGLAGSLHSFDRADPGRNAERRENQVVGAKVSGTTVHASKSSRGRPGPWGRTDMTDWTEGPHTVSDDPRRVDLARVHRWLAEESYWAQGRPIEVVRRSIENSIAFSLLDGNGVQRGFCRMVTDRATFAWLCDVFVEETYRGGGAGTFLVRCAVHHPDLVTVRRQVLGTRDAHGLYERFGYERFSDELRDRWMIRQS